jgi:hypothetical protein
MIITGDDSWGYSYNPETKQHSSQWKVKNKVKQHSSQWKVKSEVKSMIIIFIDIKGTVQKEFFLAGKTANSVYYCDALW